MTTEELQDLEKIAIEKPWFAANCLKEYLKGVEVQKNAPTGQNEPQTHSQIRTSSQHRALFLWYGQIEQICANEGVAWDRLVKHTHQLRVTKENLHEAGKQLQKALWGKASTKELEKRQIDTLIDHFIEWFGKEGVELPPFPTNEAEQIGGYKTKAGQSVVEYPEHTNTSFDET